MKTKPKTIDGYLARVRGPRRDALEQLRRTIHAIVPRAEECISYNLPAFRLDGEVIAGFAATATGCSYYPFSGSTLPALEAAVGGYSQTRGALHFDPAHPLPVKLVRQLIRTRIAESRG